MQTERYFTFVGIRNDLPKHIESKKYPDIVTADKDYPSHAREILVEHDLHEVRVYEIVAPSDNGFNDFKPLGRFFKDL
ncbi:hypothetical protein ACSS31_29055 (plasmid) [Priestia megaterium]